MRATTTLASSPSVGTRLPAPNGRIPDDTFIGEPEWDSYGGHRTRLGYQFERQLNAAWNLGTTCATTMWMATSSACMPTSGKEGFWKTGARSTGRGMRHRTDTRINNADLLAQGKLTIGRHPTHGAVWRRRRVVARRQPGPRR